MRLRGKAEGRPWLRALEGLAGTDLSMSFFSPSVIVRTILLMSQRGGHQESKKKLETSPSETMKAEEENYKEDRELKSEDWRPPSVFGVADLKNRAVGLYNIGQTCCLNSLLQAFFMNIHFTKILRRISVPVYGTQKENNVPYQMLLLLEKMQCGKQKAVSPTELAICLLRHRVEMFVQCDAAQLFLTLWNLLKKQMKNPELVEKLSDLYTITVQEHLACQICSSETTRNSSMLTLPVPLLASDSCMLKTLEECLQCFFHSEELTGHNMCFCEHCGKKTPFQQSVKLVHLPQTLTIHLKRFCFGRSAYIHKISNCLSFPQDLDFNAVLTEQQYQAYDNEKDQLAVDITVPIFEVSPSANGIASTILLLNRCRGTMLEVPMGIQTSTGDKQHISCFT
ncbi:ubl carboxyl-terminal hydrolase 18 isoform X2 [Excalfactoria chinensis]|uniref:ubl carboxyl-terminal hydrolase 18 isoform X2 n=1 Tax=Excalfactoria chinensis TaxID=46218 RepID=UPI003B3A092D